MHVMLAGDWLARTDLQEMSLGNVGSQVEDEPAAWHSSKEGQQHLELHEQELTLYWGKWFFCFPQNLLHLLQALCPALRPTESQNIWEPQKVKDILKCRGLQGCPAGWSTYPVRTGWGNSTCSLWKRLKYWEDIITVSQNLQGGCEGHRGRCFLRKM